MEVRRVLYMKGGVGDESYARNSTMQGTILSLTNTVVQEAVTDMYCTTFLKSIAVADLGCSSGPNALLVASEIIETVKRKCRQLRRRLPELSLLLNDLPGNDFNTIFRYLPEFYRRKGLNQGNGTTHGRCFVSAVPGSFYGRLFPSKSLHFVHSSSSLHWLSQVPPELQSESNMPLNKGKIFISKTSPPCVSDAYAKQFHRDFSLFLKCRSEEIITGGQMVLTFMSRRSSDPVVEEHSYLWELLGQVLIDMASEGLIEVEKVDSFDAPFCTPSPEELKHEIESEGSFAIKSLELFEASWEAAHNHQNCYNKATKEKDPMLEELSTAQRIAKGIRAVTESMLESHFGEAMIEDIFSRYCRHLEDYCSSNDTKLFNIVIAMVRK
ncbi:jasmonate O-methyltransferase-like [Phoenix dactylifera]|uniref:Jasmonate O-methyltransferase-like n=1 Tax=Phoenix dactylifera TaxID=42345 RepID=A0A8B9AG61_PHODC|nr:jasmonate O-methyltransferase-like [Phoenix dactylifera]